MAIIGSTTGEIWARSTSTTMTNETMTSGPGNVYQITTAAHRILDPSTSITVTCSAGTGVDTTWMNNGFDYFLGKVKLKAADDDSVITGGWLTLSSLGDIVSWSINPTKTVVETTSIGDAWKEYTATDVGYTVSLNRYYVDSNFWLWIEDGKEIILKIYEVTSSATVTGTGFWVKGYVTSHGVTMATGTVDTEAITIQPSGPIYYF